jgi:hypothetical protein
MSCGTLRAGRTAEATALPCTPLRPRIAPLIRPEYLSAYESARSPRFGSQKNISSKIGPTRSTGNKAEGIGDASSLPRSRTSASRRSRSSGSAPCGGTSWFPWRMGLTLGIVGLLPRSLSHATSVSVPSSAHPRPGCLRLGLDALGDLLCRRLHNPEESVRYLPGWAAATRVSRGVVICAGAARSCGNGVQTFRDLADRYRSTSAKRSKRWVSGRAGRRGSRRRSPPFARRWRSSPASALRSNRRGASEPRASR